MCDQEHRHRSDHGHGANKWQKKNWEDLLILTITNDCLNINSGIQTNCRLISGKLVFDLMLPDACSPEPSLPVSSAVLCFYPWVVILLETQLWEVICMYASCKTFGNKTGDSISQLLWVGFWGPKIVASSCTHLRHAHVMKVIYINI